MVQEKIHCSCHNSKIYTFIHMAVFNEVTKSFRLTENKKRKKIEIE